MPAFLLDVKHNHMTRLLMCYLYGGQWTLSYLVLVLNFVIY